MVKNIFTLLKLGQANTLAKLSAVLWPLLSAVGVLFIVVSSIVVLSLGRSEDNMVRLLVGEGSALIYAVEGSVRMSMQQRSPVQLQRTLRELVNADVRFVSVLMPDGTILAHSDESRLGNILRVAGNEVNEKLLREISQPVEDSSLRWFIANVDGKETFVVYREFTPLEPRGRNHPQNGVRKNRPRVEIFPPPEMPKRPRELLFPLVFLGLDISPFESAKRQDRVYLFSLAAGMVLMGAALLIALYYAQRAQESRRRQFVAEGQVRELEEEMRRKEKLAAIGNLAAGVAHEIRNPLSSIKGYATYFGQRFPEGSEDRQAATVMVREVERLNRVITDLIGLSRPTDVHAKATEILPVLEHVLHLLRPDAEKKQVAIRLRQPKRPLPKAMLDVDRFGQALLNICLNAMEATEHGGEVVLSAHVAHAHGKDFLAIEVRDTGHGIEEQHLQHIFDPYFTTKGQGTGLGLATVHKIVEAHGGEISVNSRHVGVPKKAISLGGPLASMLPSGTTVRILLPLADV